jgi:hypothetical protein
VGFAATPLVGKVGSNFAGTPGLLSFVSVVFCQVQFSEFGLLLIQGSPAECGVSNVCGYEAPNGKILTQNRDGRAHGN